MENLLTNLLRAATPRRRTPDDRTTVSRNRTAGDDGAGHDDRTLDDSSRGDRTRDDRTSDGRTQGTALTHEPSAPRARWRPTYETPPRYGIRIPARAGSRLTTHATIAGDSVLTSVGEYRKQRGELDSTPVKPAPVKQRGRN
jgi:hypothetical protein